MFESSNEIRIVAHGLIVASILGLHLLHEQLLLHEGVIQFGVRIAQLMVVDEELEAFSQPSLRTVLLSQRTHDLRVVDDEGGVQEARFHEVPNQLIQQPCS